MDSESVGENGKRESKTAKIICIILTIFAIITLILGFYLKNPIWFVAGIVPAALYEAWRTEGYFTKIASVGIAILVILEVLALSGKIHLDLAQTFNTSEAYLAGYNIPLGEIKFIFPVVAVILSFILVQRTYGPYTKWLAIILAVNSVSLLFLTNKEALLNIINYFI